MTSLQLTCLLLLYMGRSRQVLLLQTPLAMAASQALTPGDNQARRFEKK